jgi:ribonucleoside-triphosphate reductase
MIELIRKRNGTFCAYDNKKITLAILKAMKSVQKEDFTKALELTTIIENTLNQKYHKKTIPSVEEIQDIVESTLIENNLSDVAKSYILYREDHRKARERKDIILDIKSTMDNYLTQSDWRVYENSNINFSLGGLILHNSGAITANYWLENIYDKEISTAHKNGDFHIHDLCMFSGYCAGWSLRQLITEGLGGVPGKISSKPAKHLSTLIQQMVNFLGILQNEWAGAQAFSSFDTYLAPFVRADNLSYSEVKQQIQSFVFGINTPSRWGSQSPFTNITLDWVVPDDLKDQPVIVGGNLLDSTYKEYQNEMDIINKAFLEVFMEGDANGRGFSYPIPTYNLTKNFNWDSDNANLLFKITAKYGTPYFQNFINSSLNPTDVRSMCCRLQLNRKELRNRGGGLFGADEFTGSIGVVTINLPRIGYLSKTKEEYFKKLEYLMDLAKRSLEIKRECISNLMEKGLFPYTKRYLKHWNNHFSTIGLIGMNESTLNFIKKDLTSREAIDFTKEVLNFMRNKLIQYQTETGHLFNLEATPGEGTSYRLAKIDKKMYPNIITAGDKEPYYTNSTQLPVNATDNIFDALEIQNELQRLYTGGTVFHTFIGEAIEDIQTCKKLIKSIAENYEIPYFTITPTYSICNDHGYIKGETNNCPICNKETEIYSRIVGYYRPVQNWNAGKKTEFKERKEYKINKINGTHKTNIIPCKTIYSYVTG